MHFEAVKDRAGKERKMGSYATSKEACQWVTACQWQLAVQAQHAVAT